MFVDWRREVTFGCGIIGNFEKPRVQEIGLQAVVSKQLCGAAAVYPGKNWNKKCGKESCVTTLKVAV